MYPPLRLLNTSLDQNVAIAVEVDGGSGVARGGFGGFKPPPLRKVCIFYCLNCIKQWLMVKINLKTAV